MNNPPGFYRTDKQHFEGYDKSVCDQAKEKSVWVQHFDVVGTKWRSVHKENEAKVYKVRYLVVDDCPESPSPSKSSILSTIHIEATWSQM